MENKESQNQPAETETEREGAEIAEELEQESKEFDKLQEELLEAKDKYIRLLRRVREFPPPHGQGELRD